MARIPLVQENDPAIPEDAAEFLRRAKGDRGFILNIHRAFANHPEVARAFFRFSNTVRFNKNLTPAQSELAYTASTVANSCYY